MKWNWIVLFVFGLFFSCDSDSSTYVEMETDYGNMKMKLYDSTPQHRDNFIELVNEGYYENMLFHRVMTSFMIQAGDPVSKVAQPNQQLGGGGPGYTIPAEIGMPHFKGALAAARQPDQVNPAKVSNGSQFFIVQGEKQNDQMLNSIAQSKGIQYTEEQKKIYRELGGYPSLDQEYTVFGEVVEGFEVIDKIAAVQTNQADRPLEDIRIIKMTILK